MGQWDFMDSKSISCSLIADIKGMDNKDLIQVVSNIILENTKDITQDNLDEILSSLSRDELERVSFKVGKRGIIGFAEWWEEWNPVDQHETGE